MFLKVLSSSSLGNCYIIENNDEAIIIEAGVNIKKIKENLNFNLDKIRGVIISHVHL